MTSRKRFRQRLLDESDEAVEYGMIDEVLERK